jgi:CBS domain-containing protein
VRARDIMTQNVITVQRDTPVQDIIQTLLDNRISGVPVVESKKVVGIISEGDLILRERARRPRSGMAYLAKQLFEDHTKLAEEFRKAHGMIAEEVMSTRIITCPPSMPVEEIANLMAEHHVKRLPVVEDGQLVGLVSRADVLRAAAQRLALLEGRALPSAVTDDEIRSTLVETLRREPWAEVHLIQVEVQGGVVTLRGSAESQQELEALALAARRTPGVRGVSNELVVNAAAALE